MSWSCTTFSNLSRVSPWLGGHPRTWLLTPHRWVQLGCNWRKTVFLGQRRSRLTHFIQTYHNRINDESLDKFMFFALGRLHTVNTLWPRVDSLTSKPKASFGDSSKRLLQLRCIPSLICSVISQAATEKQSSRLRIISDVVAAASQRCLRNSTVFSWVVKAQGVHRWQEGTFSDQRYCCKCFLEEHRI